MCPPLRGCSAGEQTAQFFVDMATKEQVCFFESKLTHNKQQLNDAMRIHARHEMKQKDFEQTMATERKLQNKTTKLYEFTEELPTMLSITRDVSRDASAERTKGCIKLARRASGSDTTAPLTSQTQSRFVLSKGIRALSLAGGQAENHHH